MNIVLLVRLRKSIDKALKDTQSSISKAVEGVKLCCRTLERVEVLLDCSKDLVLILADLVMILVFPVLVAWARTSWPAVVSMLWTKVKKVDVGLVLYPPSVPLLSGVSSPHLIELSEIRQFRSGRNC